MSAGSRRVKPSVAVESRRCGSFSSATMCSAQWLREEARGSRPPSVSVALGAAHGQRLVRAVDADQRSLAAAGAPTGSKGSGLPSPLAEAEGAGGIARLPAVPFGVQEQLVDRRDQRGGRAVVGAQLVVAAVGGARAPPGSCGCRRRGSRRSTASGRRSGTGPCAGSLSATRYSRSKMRYWSGEVSWNSSISATGNWPTMRSRSAAPFGAFQRALQARQHVGEAELAAAPLQLRHAPRDVRGGVAQQRVRQRLDARPAPRAARPLRRSRRARRR